MVTITSRFFVSPYSSHEIVGGTEIIGHQYCKALDLKYISARTIGAEQMEYWEISKNLDDWLRSEQHIDLLIRNSVVGTTFDFKKPNTDLDIAVCFEHFETEGKCLDDIGWRQEKNRRFERQLISIGSADIISVLSNIEKDLFESNGFSNIKVIEPYVDTNIFYPKNRILCREELCLPKNKKISLFVGRAHKRKGFDVVLEAAEKFSDILFISIFGHEIPRIKKPDNMIFLGNEDQESVNNYYNASDVLFMPSRYESFGLIYAEAMCCGLQVIGYATGLLGKPKEFKNGIFINDGEYSKEKLFMMLNDALHNEYTSEDLERHRTRFSKSRFEKDCAELIK